MVANTPQSRKATKLKPRSPKQFKTDIDDEGRVCTKCNMYKLWEDFKTSSKPIVTKRASSCKQCEKEKRPSRATEKDRFCAKKRRKELKKSNPILVKARDTRGRLLNRVSGDLKGTTPTVLELEKWFNSSLVCFYSGESLTLKTVTVDHKIPLARGGTNELTNLCFASNHMNTAKGRMTDKEFKSLLIFVSTWEDGGKSLLTRLKQGHFG